LNLARADSSTKPAVSNLYISDSQSTVAINLPPNSNDVNFYIQSPIWYSYFAIGIGSEMANSLMLLVYSAADSQRRPPILSRPYFPVMTNSMRRTDVTVSTRLGT